MLFRYSAIDRLGVAQHGEREAPDEASLSKGLRTEGLLLTLANPVERSLLGRLGTISFGGVSLFDRMVFARNLAVMVGAGLPMTRSLEALEEQASNKKFKEIIRDLRERITKGLPFSQALLKHRETFGNFFIHMVEAGELSGKLEGSLKLLAKQMRRDHDLRAKVRGALMYPAIVTAALVLIGALMLKFVVPTLAATFADLKIDLPITTQFIILASGILERYALYVLGILALLVYGALRLLKWPPAAALSDRATLRIPLFGPLIKKMNAARMARTLSSLIGAGLSITKALEVTSGVLGNARFRDSVASAMGEIEKGRQLSEILKQFPDLYPPLVIQMIAVGEETGTLSHMLVRIALFYEEDVNNTTKNLSSIIEPILMIVIGAVVGFFAISMIQPLYSSLSNI